MRTPAALSFAIWLAACGGGHGGGVDRDVEPRLTIAQGVYGQTTSVDDVGDTTPRYLRMTLAVYAAPRGPDAVAVATMTSDDHGFYQAALPAGDHVICTAFERCATFTVSEGARIRMDYEFSVGPGWYAGRIPW